MPALLLKCTKDVTPEFCEQVSSVVAETIGKPEQYVMVVAERADVMMSGEAGDAAFAEVKSIGGLSRTVNHELTMKLCDLLSGHFGIPADRVYITFQSFERDHWGWNKATFG